MRILVISELFPPDVLGGYELRCEEACCWLDKKGYQVSVLTTQSEHKADHHPFPVHRLLSKRLSAGTPVYWPTWKYVYHALLDNYAFTHMLSQTNPDLIYVWKCSEISRSLIPLVLQTRIPKLVDISANWLHKVATQHGPVYRRMEERDGPLSSTIKQRMYKMLPLLSFDLIPREYAFDWSNIRGYFTSHWNKRFHVERIPECNSFPVFYTGVDLDMFPFVPKHHVSDAIRLLFVGRICEDKGFLLLLDQIREVKARDVVVTVIGAFPTEREKTRTQSSIKAMGLEAQVSFLGSVPRDLLASYYRQCDFTVFPSIADEAFSRVPLESMACGTPCISTDNSGSKELFDLNAPLILLSHTAGSLADIIDAFAHNHDQYQQVSGDGRAFVERSFTFDGFMQNIESNFLAAHAPDQIGINRQYTQRCCDTSAQPPAPNAEQPASQEAV